MRSTKPYWRAMNKRQGLLLFLGALHLFSIVATNTVSAIHAYQQYHGQVRPKQISKVLDSTVSLCTYRLYGLLSGTAYGYGFFAPNVASQYISSFQYFDREGTLLYSEALPPMVGIEGLQRYSIWLDQFQRYLRERAEVSSSANFYRRYLEASLHSLMQKLLQEDDRARSLRCVIYLHEPPALATTKDGTKAIKIYEHCLNK